MGGACFSVLACWQVDEDEYVVFNEAGETQEDGVEEETHDAQTFVQCPLVQMNPQDLKTDRDTETGV